MYQSDRQIKQIGQIYSYIGYKCISGCIDSMKFLYGNIFLEHPALIETVNQLQLCLTPVEVEYDTQNRYNNEFLYFWGMCCIGGLSRLVEINLTTAEFCFQKIKDNVPKANARLAYISLLKTTEPHNSDMNSSKLEILRTWAGKQDMFSRIALARIVYEHFLDNRQPRESEISLKVLSLLRPPYRKGHPEAIKFYRAIVDNTNETDTFIFNNSKNTHINIDALYDF